MSANLVGTMLKTRAFLLGATLLAFLASLIMATPAMADVLPARTISNVATIAWDAGGQHVELPSNRVDVEVTPSAGAVLETFRLADGTFPPALLAGTCTAANQTQALNSESGETPPLSSFDLIATSELIAGRPLVLAVDRPAANRDSQAIETLRVFVTTPWGDREEITLTETSADSGRFVGIILTTTGPPVPGDCRLSAHANEPLTLTMKEMNRVMDEMEKLLAAKK